jgi:hypothetical protein
MSTRILPTFGSCIVSVLFLLAWPETACHAAAEGDPEPQELFTRALRLAAAVEDLSNRHLLIMTIAVTQSATGDDRGALAIVKLIPSSDGRLRSSALSQVAIVQAYCKDSGIFTASGDTIDPLPFHGMAAYPYLPGPHVPLNPGRDKYQREYNTREGKR